MSGLACAFLQTCYVVAELLKHVLGELLLFFLAPAFFC